MRLSNERVGIIPYEPQVHGPLVYRWFHSGEYQTLFENMPLFTIEHCMRLQNVYMIVNPKNPQEVFGAYVLRNLDERNRNLQVHAMIVKDHQNSGIVKEAGRFMMYYIMNCMNFYKVISIIREDNVACETAAKKFGFELEGVLKHEIYVDGEFHNMKRYYMTKGMFNKRYKQALEAEVKGESHAISR